MQHAVIPLRLRGASGSLSRRRGWPPSTHWELRGRQLPLPVKGTLPRLFLSGFSGTFWWEAQSTRRWLSTFPRARSEKGGQSMLGSHPGWSHTADRSQERGHLGRAGDYSRLSPLFTAAKQTVPKLTGLKQGQETAARGPVQLATCFWKQFVWKTATPTLFLSPYSGFRIIMAELSHCDRNCMTPKKLKYLLCGPFQKKRLMTLAWRQFFMSHNVAVWLCWLLPSSLGQPHSAEWWTGWGVQLRLLGSLSLCLWGSPSSRRLDHISPRGGGRSPRTQVLIRPPPASCLLMFHQTKQVTRASPGFKGKGMNTGRGGSLGATMATVYYIGFQYFFWLNK